MLIRLIGPAAVECDGRQGAGLRGRKAWAVLCLLVLGERPPSRRYIADLLFADAADPLGALRWILAELRRVLGPTVELGGDPLELDLGPDCVTDVDLVLSGRWARAVTVGCLDGELLDGLEFAGCEAFESWLLVERRRLASACSAVLVEAAHGLLDQGRPQEAARLTARAILRDPLDEAAHTLLVHSLTSGGNRKAARRQAAASRRFFQRELGVVPLLLSLDAGRERAAPSLVPNRQRMAAASRLEIGKAALGAGAVDTALEHLRHAAASAAEHDDPGLLGASLVCLDAATVHAVACRDRSAAVVLRRSLDLARRSDDRHTAVTALRELAFIDLCSGRHDRSLDRTDDAARIAGDDDRDVAGVLAVRGARELAPSIAARSTEIEAVRRIPRDLLGDLVGAGCFWVLLPAPSAASAPTCPAPCGSSRPWPSRRVGGLDRDDRSGRLVRPRRPARATLESLFSSGPDVIVAGAINPTGSIAAVDDGYRVTGRWGFASGCEHADWLVGNCVEGNLDGDPQLRLAIFAPDQVVIEDTWTVSGLSGTGSHHFRADDVVVPAERTVLILAAEPCLDDAIVRIPPPAFLSLGIASVAIGTARAALDDIVALAADKVPVFAQGSLAANPLFQLELATADTQIRAARALLFETAEAAWATAIDRPPTLEERARTRSAAVWVTEAAAAVVTTAYRFGGGSSVYSDCALQRRLRDIHALTQHFLVKRNTLTTAGAILAGQDVEVMVF